MLNAILEQQVATGGWVIDDDKGIPKKWGHRNMLDGLGYRCRSGEKDRQLRHIETGGFVEVLLENTRLREETGRLRADLACICGVIASGELGASLAHEMKQPIAAAVSNAEACLQWLARDEPDLKEMREAATEMVKESRRAAEIMTRTLSLFKKEEVAREAIDLNEVIADTVLLIREEVQRYSISVRTELDGGLPRISANFTQLQQVLMNLMMNGIEAMKDKGGELTVRSKSTEDGQVLTAVSDVGGGLLAEGTEHIFEAFFTTKPEGTGLGLSISRTIIESHDGRLWASANAGRGATFQFTLPTRGRVRSRPA